MIININKPKGITSHDVVDRLRKITGEKKVGHAGTLDPFATGVLVLGVTRESTKQLGEISKNTDKEYAATLKLGETTETLDPETKVIKINPGKVSSLTKENIEETLQGFQGTINQRPPRYSAIKIDGERAYKKARRGEDFKLPERIVEIKSIELKEYDPPHLKIHVECGRGTYIRSLARDIGEKLGTGAYLTDLVRTRVGKYKIEDSQILEELKETL